MTAAAKHMPRLKNLDDLFRLNDGADLPAAENTPQSANEYSIVPFSQIDDYPGHPFRIYEGERESDMVESIRSNGILQPLILRGMDNGRYQVLSGHNRKYCGMKAGLTACPAVIKKNITDDEALVYVIETNLMQRSFADMSHSEKAAVITAHHSKLFSQGKRNDVLAELKMLENQLDYRLGGTCAQVAHKLKSREIVAVQYSLSKDTIARYLRIHKLISSLKTRLDACEIAFLSAVTLSFLSESDQHVLAGCLEQNRFTVDMKKAGILRDYSEKNKLNEESVYMILSGEIGQKPNRTPEVKVSKAVYTKYFKPGQSAKEVQTIIEKALALYFNQTQ